MAGRCLQDECDKKNAVSEGNIAVLRQTGGLNCRAVIFAICSPWGNGKGRQVTLCWIDQLFPLMSEKACNNEYWRSLRKFVKAKSAWRNRRFWRIFSQTRHSEISSADLAILTNFCHFRYCMYPWTYLLDILAVNGPESEIRFGFSCAGICPIGAAWRFLIGIKQCGGHSPGTRLSFGIECI